MEKWFLIIITVINVWVLLWKINWALCSNKTWTSKTIRLKNQQITTTNLARGYIFLLSYLLILSENYKDASCI